MSLCSTGNHMIDFKRFILRVTEDASTHVASSHSNTEIVLPASKKLFQVGGQMVVIRIETIQPEPNFFSGPLSLAFLTEVLYVGRG